jgi:site-specific DNA recombinase
MIVQHYKDEAISGSRSDRPAYQRMLKAATAREFDALLVDDLSRFSRDQVESERAIRRLEFAGIRILAISDGYDSHSKAHKVLRAIKGLTNEQYLDDLRDKTHRGLTGQALKQFWAGGKPYGFRLVRIKDPARVDAYGEPLALGTRLEIDAGAAPVVREMFTRYADGWSPRAIANDLNKRRIPSPGSSWRNRSVRRTAGWLGSAVKALVASELYRG